MHGVCALVLTLSLLFGTTAARAEDTAPTLPSAEEVVDGLKRTLTWTQQARAAMQTAREAAVVLTARDDERMVVAVLQRAFDAARAQATLVERTAEASASPATESPAEDRTARRARRRAKLEAAIREGEREVTRLRERGRDGDARAAANRLALDRMRLDLLVSLQQTDAALASGEPALMQQIQALQDSVPELNPQPAPAKTAAAAAPAPAPRQAAADGTWSVTHRLVALQRARNSLSQLGWSTESLERDTDTEAQRIRDALRERSRALRAMVAPAAAGSDAPAKVDEEQFRRELEVLKQLGAALVPLRAEAALLDRFSGDIRSWQRTIDRESRKALQELGLGLIGLVIGVGAILIGSLVWKIAASRYVKDPYRRRLLLRARKIVIAVAFVLLLVFHFTSELTALVTALGFAAAGIAFALQNVILAIAGYFSMMAPNGIRVGDRVSLQGPFGYVHGEVIEIGLVRVRLRELTADGLEPTGRTVVFPNSVMFTGSFFKHPPEARAA